MALNGTSKQCQSRSAIALNQRTWADDIEIKP